LSRNNKDYVLGKQVKGSIIFYSYNLFGYTIKYGLKMVIGTIIITSNTLKAGEHEMDGGERGIF
jgi:hypothetical protein